MEQKSGYELINFSTYTSDTACILPASRVIHTFYLYPCFIHHRSTEYSS